MSTQALQETREEEEGLKCEDQQRTFPILNEQAVGVWF